MLGIACLMIGGWLVPSHAGAAGYGTGYDISWPQCGGAYPGGGFNVAVVGVTGGHGFSQNPCLASEFGWAKQATHPPDLYVNTDLPTAAPAQGQDGPAGHCAAGASQCFAYNYGYNNATAAVKYAFGQGVDSRVWWLDVETNNNWQTAAHKVSAYSTKAPATPASPPAYAYDNPDNSRAVQGGIDGLQASGKTAGVYSTNYQWGLLVGSSYKPGVPSWYATGEAMSSSTAGFCDSSQWGFGGGPVWLVQYNAGNYDGDYACTTEVGWGPLVNVHIFSSPSVAVAGTTQIVFWEDQASHLGEAWYSGAWNGPQSHPEFGAMLSAPSAAVTKDAGHAQVVFWEGPGGHLMEAWFSGGWNGPVDWTATWGGVGALSSAPTVATMSNGRQIVFWRGVDNHLWEAWFDNGHWNGPVNWSGLGTLASAPSVALTTDETQQTVFWQGADSVLTEVWFNGAWNGPAEWSGFSGMASAPTAVIEDGQQIVFYRDGSGHLVEGWFTGHWNGPVDWTVAAFHGYGPLTSAPSAAITPDGQQVVFWQGQGTTFWEAWFNSSGWNGPIDYSAG